MSVYIAALPFSMFAQASEEIADTAWRKVLRESYPKTNELVHKNLMYVLIMTNHICMVKNGLH